MKILLILLAIFIPSTLIAKAETSITGQVENVELNIKEHEAAVTFLGLSAGEATLVQGPNNENILINVGGKGTKAELESWLSLYNINEISTLILTNGVQEISYSKINQVITKYKIKKIITTPELSKLIAKNLDQSMPISFISWVEGTKKEILPEMTAEVQFVGNEPNEGMDLMLNFFEHNIFLMTSFSHRAEQTLLKKNLKDVNVFKIPNSNKEDTLSDQFIQYLNPQISILFAVKEHQPNINILHDLHSIWSEVYFTKKHGTVTIKFTESNYEVITIPAEVDER
ncbi:hypothetical protein QNH20_17200 [Neobacillus sp. WH10]|uniref:hypothetical protein n=1 Tax=Neobacillus sp. WH10 TaxID=3047873 RepID=UPI0024C11C5C|nr:hypothetical protein [Neobacillus sp. WH10]WHY75853.1 hypothetical protein QNH20_17200 [Neobacillus sp. WH10]